MPGSPGTATRRRRPTAERATHWLVLELTAGVGVDVAVEVGGSDSFTKSSAATWMGGRISVVGLVSGLPQVGHEFFFRAQRVAESLHHRAGRLHFGKVVVKINGERQ